MSYEKLSPELSRIINNDRLNNTLPNFAFNDDDAIRRNNEIDKSSVIRSSFIRDIDKILNCPYYNRYADKTQVFSFYKNDDITRRSLHVQLVSRIARTIGKSLNLNQELIEAIALGHDIGHTPFGHAGESFLDEIFCSHTGRHFSHNIHSVRVLDQIFPYNISLQTLNGIASHDGEFEMPKYTPERLCSFAEFDKQIENCYLDKNNIKKLVPATLEGCVMRISDIIAYLGKDRQDAERMHLIKNDDFYKTSIGIYNAEIINNLTVNIIENSYNKPFIEMDRQHFNALKQAKKENYQLIYKNDELNQEVGNLIKPMMEEIYEELLSHIKCGKISSPIFSQHIKYITSAHYKRPMPYEETEHNQIVVDYIASMTDDYFIDLYDFLFPKSTKKIIYSGYFG